jgi:hypothetical protein
MRADERDQTPGWALREVACRRCGTEVLVRKSSVAQTSVQWRGSSAELCTELAQHRAAGVHPALVPACASLRASIDEAVRDGLLEVADS